jgi:hypothetical protein
MGKYRGLLVLFGALLIWGIAANAAAQSGFNLPGSGASDIPPAQVPVPRPTYHNCPGGSVWDGSRCNCPKGTKWVGGRCVPIGGAPGVGTGH